MKENTNVCPHTYCIRICIRTCTYIYTYIDAWNEFRDLFSSFLVLGGRRGWRDEEEKGWKEGRKRFGFFSPLFNLLQRGEEEGKL